MIHEDPRGGRRTRDGGRTEGVRFNLASVALVGTSGPIPVGCAHAAEKRSWWSRLSRPLPGPGLARLSTAMQDKRLDDTCPLYRSGMVWVCE